MRFSHGSVLTVACTLGLLTLAACSSNGNGSGQVGSYGTGTTSTGQGGFASTSSASSSTGAPTSGNIGSGSPVSGTSGVTGGVTGVSTASGGATTSGSGATGGSVLDDCTAVPTGSITFSPASGTFEGSISVELGTGLAGAEIRYTTDRTPPNINSPLYAGAPLVFSNTTQLAAQAFVQGAPVGTPQVAVFASRQFDAMHDLPVIVLDSFGQVLPDPQMGGNQGQSQREFMDVTAMVFEPGSTGVTLAATPTLASGAAFHIRGQSSASYPKRPYRLELRDATGIDRDCPVLGMPAEADWVLHSPYPDKALIRNAFVYSLGPDVGLAAPRAVLAELYVNTSGQPLTSEAYQGVYLLVETIKNQKNRLDLRQLRPENTVVSEISGGYIFKFEWRVSSIEQELPCPNGQDNCWGWLEVVDPDPWVAQQQDYLTQYLQSFVNALHSAAASDPTTGYPAFIDSASFVNHIIINELTRNLDAYTRSQFFHKDRAGKIVAGPLWDFDLTAGVGSSANFANMDVEGWQYESVASRFPDTADWFPVLLAEPTFHAELVNRWLELRAGPLSDAQVSARIAQLTAGLSAGAQRNFQKWEGLLTEERVGFFDTPTLPTWEEHVSAMQQWLIARMAWLDSQWH